MILILNKANRREFPTNIPVFPVDRSTPVGNPFFMKLEAERDAVCDQFQQYFEDMVAEAANKSFLDYLETIFVAAQHGDIALSCWCAPKRCHAETIRAYIERRLQDGSPTSV